MSRPVESPGSVRPPAPVGIDPEHPWPGLASFTEEQAGLFFGRDAEVRDLTRRVQRHSLTVLFGQSGLGKSSLLQAGVFPRLRTSGYWPVYVRLDHGPEAPPLADQVKALVAGDSRRAVSWSKPAAAKPGESLWEFFHHRDDRLIDGAGEPLVPVLAFDQFEELFTLGAGGGAQRDRAVAFISQLAELVENRPSEQLVARLEDSSDEMEAFDFGRADYRVVIILREDFLPEFEALQKIMPAIMQNRMRLARMTGTQALEAVLKPGAGIVTEEVARTVVEFVAGARGGSVERLAELEVEPPLLSVICRELNERRRKLGQPQITADLVTGNRREILNDFYDRSVADLPETVRTFVEDRLLTKSGFRDNVALETALEEPGVTRPLIDTLVARRLLRIEDRLGVQRVELTHDVLAEVIRTSRDERQQRLAVAELHARERLTRRRMWLARGIAAGLLVGLSGVSWIAWRAVQAEREQAKARSEAEVARVRESELRLEVQGKETAARRLAYASDMNALQRALDMNNLGRARELLYRQVPKAGEADFRGWEWRYLWQFCQPEFAKVLSPPTGALARTVQFLPDGKTLAVARSGKSVVELHNALSGEAREIRESNPVLFVAASPVAPVLAIATQERVAYSTAGGFDRTRVRLWSTDSLSVLREFELTGFCGGIAFTADGEQLICTAGRVRFAAEATNPEAEISLWRTADATRLKVWRGGATNSGLTDRRWFAASSRGTAAAVRKPNGNLAVIDLQTGRERWEHPASTRGALASLAFSPDNRLLASGSAYVESQISIWDAETGDRLKTLDGHNGWIADLQFLRDGRHLVSASADQTIRVWDVTLGRVIRTLKGHRTELRSITISPDERMLVSGGKDGTVYRWDLATSPLQHTSGEVVLGAQPEDWIFRNDSVISVSRDGRIRRTHGDQWQSEDTVFEVPGLGAAYRTGYGRALLARGHPLVAFIERGGIVHVWDWERRMKLCTWKAPSSSSVYANAFSSDGTRVALRHGWPDVTLTVLEVSSVQPVQAVTLPKLTSPPRRLEYSPSLQRAIGAYDSQSPSVAIDFQTGTVEWRKLEFDIPSLPSYSPDERRLFVPSMTGFVKVFEAESYAAAAVFPGFMFGAHAVAVPADQTRVFIGSTAHEALTVWDPVSHERLLTLPAMVSVLRPLTLSPDGNVLLGSERDGRSLYFWRAPSWAEITRLDPAARTSGTAP